MVCSTQVKCAPGLKRYKGENQKKHLAATTKRFNLNWGSLSIAKRKTPSDRDQ